MVWKSMLSGVTTNSNIQQNKDGQLLNIPTKIYQEKHWTVLKDSRDYVLGNHILEKGWESMEKKTDHYFYPAIFTYEPGQEISVVFPDLDCATSGETEDDALLSARELLGCVLLGLEEDSETIPVPTPLYNVSAGRNERAVLIDVYMPFIREQHNNRSVNRTVTLPAWLSDAASENNINCSQVLQEALIQKIQAK